MTITSKKVFFCFLTVVVCCLLMAPPAPAVFGSKEEQQGLHSLRDLIKRPIEDRTPSEEEVKLFTSLTQDASFLARLSAVSGLAFANDTQSLEILKTLSQNLEKSHDATDFTLDLEVRGIAYYASLMRNNALLDRQQLFNVLREQIQKAENPLERMFIANRLSVDFGEQAVPVILQAAKAEAVQMNENFRKGSFVTRFNVMVMVDMLYYLSQTKDLKVLEEVSQWRLGKWREGAQDDAFLPKEYLLLLIALSPGRSADEEENGWKKLQQRIQNKLANK